MLNYLRRPSAWRAASTCSQRRGCSPRCPASVWNGFGDKGGVAHGVGQSGGSFIFSTFVWLRRWLRFVDTAPLTSHRDHLRTRIRHMEQMCCAASADTADVAQHISFLQRSDKQR